MDQQHDNEPEPTDERARYRPPIGMPLRGEGRWGAPFSFAVHVVLILLLITPVFARVVAPELFPGGGLGPAGGGGGGRGGTGGWRPEPITPERLRYMRLAPEPPAPETPEAKPEVVPVPKEETPPPEPDPPVEQVSPQQPAADAAPLPGAGAGTGKDGTAGTGPGTGGGVGSGVGTGTGSGTGSGTGGGDGKDYLPTPDFLPLPPEPRPGKVRGRSVAVVFTVNERGEIVSLDFATTGDRGYDRRFREALRQVRFRPAVGRDGQPMAATFPITFQL